MGSRLFLPLKNVLEGAGFDVVAAFVPQGEHRKHLKSTEELSSLLVEGAIGSDAGVLAFGGGAVADLAGFVAGTYLGGLPYAQVATTLTAQLENLALRRPALNHPQQKNLIAVGHAPCLVWNDLRYLDSLPRRERLSGLCTLIARAAGRYRTLFEYVEENIERLIRFEPAAIADVVARATRLSVKDDGEYGPHRRMGPLPGDRIGDALQLAGRFRAIPYGETRLLGLLTEGYLAIQSGMLERPEFDRMVRMADALPIKLTLGTMKPWDILRALKHDRKVMVRARHVPLLVRVGEESPGNELDDRQLTEAFRWALDWANGLSALQQGGSTS